MEYFKLEEFYHSDTAVKRGIDNIPKENKEEIDRNIKALICNVLLPARIALGRPIVINSGYRCHELNKAVGGAKTSQHIKGEAADIVCADMHRLFAIIKGLEFDQLIWEKGGQWIHVSYTTHRKNRKQVLYT